MVDIERLGRILFNIWDPLDVNQVGVTDEYNFYAREIGEMMNQGKEDTQILEYMRCARKKSLLIAEDDERDRLALIAIRAL